MKRPHLVITFPTTADAMEMERCCKEEGIAGKLIPAPHSMSTGCGMAWMGEVIDEKEQEAWLLERDIEWEMMKVLEI